MAPLYQYPWFEGTVREWDGRGIGRGGVVWKKGRWASEQERRKEEEQEVTGEEEQRAGGRMGTGQWRERIH